MAPTRAWSTPKSTGEQVTAAEFNALDDGQYYALVRNGAAALTAASEVTHGSYDLKFKAASTGRVKFEDAWPEVSGTIATVTNFVPSCTWVPEDASKWVPKGDYWEAADATASHLYVHLWLPIGLTVSSATIYVRNPAPAVLPGVMPYILFRERQANVDTSVTSYGPTSDTSASAAAYNAIHAITHTLGTPCVITGNYAYSVRVTNETTAAGLRVYRPVVSGTLAALRTV